MELAIIILGLIIFLLILCIVYIVRGLMQTISKMSELIKAETLSEAVNKENKETNIEEENYTEVYNMTPEEMKEASVKLNII